MDNNWICIKENIHLDVKVGDRLSNLSFNGDRVRIDVSGSDWITSHNLNLDQFLKHFKNIQELREEKINEILS
jgi:hypothetical protein